MPGAGVVYRHLLNLPMVGAGADGRRHGLYIDNMADGQGCDGCYAGCATLAMVGTNAVHRCASNYRVRRVCLLPMPLSDDESAPGCALSILRANEGSCNVAILLHMVYGLQHHKVA